MTLAVVRSSQPDVMLTPALRVVRLGENSADAARQAVLAQTAATAALAAAGVQGYANTAAGLAATGVADLFWVDQGDGTGKVYRHDSGPVATFLRDFIINPTDDGAAALIGTPHGKLDKALAGAANLGARSADTAAAVEELLSATSLVEGFAGETVPLDTTPHWTESARQLRGNGTTLYNPNADSPGVGGDGAAVTFGCSTLDDIQVLTQHTVNAIFGPVITLATGGGAAFAAGDLMWLQGDAHYVSGGSSIVPRNPWACRVLAVNGDVVTVDRAPPPELVAEIGVGAGVRVSNLRQAIAFATAIANPGFFYWADKPTVRDTGFKSDLSYGLRLNGVYEGKFENDDQDGRNGLAPNALFFCDIDTFRFRAWHKAIEFAQGCYGTTVRNFWGQMYDAANGVDPPSMWCRIGENSAHCKFIDHRVHLGTRNIGNVGIAVLLGGHDNEVAGATWLAPQHTGSGLAVSAGPDAGNPAVDNGFRNCRIVGPTVKSFASSLLSFDLTISNFADGETVTIDGKAYTAQATLTNADGHFKIGGSALASLQNLAAAINLGAGSGTAYAAATTLHSTVRAETAATSTLAVTAKAAGSAGGSIATTETAAHASWQGATLRLGMGHFITCSDQSAVGIVRPYFIGCRFLGLLGAGSYAANLLGTDVQVIDCWFEHGACFLDSAMTAAQIRGNYFPDGFANLTGALLRANPGIRDNESDASRRLSNASVVDDPGTTTTVTATATNSVCASATFAAGDLKAGDVITVFSQAQTAAGTGTARKGRFSTTQNGSESGVTAISVTDSAALGMDITITVISNSVIEYEGWIGASHIVGQRVGLDLDTYGLTVNMEYWVTNAGEPITVRRRRIVGRKPGMKHPELR